MRDSDLDRLNTALTGRHEVDREIGAGGMATVYLARDLKHDRKVALKVLRPELAAVIGAERFLSEIKTTANLQHPHILPLFDSGSADGQLFYVMPFVEGETLRGRLECETQLPVADAVRLATEIAGALEYAHRRGVVHRDIKPENILLQDGSALVADFGIALAVQQAGGERMTQTGMSLGTPQYMSPEQAMGQKVIDARSDLYALGAVTYEMLIGEPPFTGPSAQAIVAKVMTESPKELTAQRKTVPANVAAAVANALEKLPADRFASAGEFAQALANVGYGRGRAATAGDPGASPSRAARWTRVAAALVLLAAGVGIGVLLTRSKPVALQVARFAMAVNPGQRLNVNAFVDRPFALSPDGSRVVFSATDSGARAVRLHVRMLDQFTATPIPGTEGALNPFFSPDGLWIGFVTGVDGTLRKVAATGGPVSALATEVTPTLGSASWGDDGFIVYPNQRGRLARVSAGGGTSVLLTDSAMIAFARAPVVLPGGRAILLAGCTAGFSTAECPTGLYAFDRIAGKLKLLVEGGTRGWYLPGGYLVYGTIDGALYAVMFDVGKLAVTSAPVALLDGLNLGRYGMAHMAIASSSGTMAYLPAASTEHSVIVQVDRAGREQVIVPKAGPYSDPRLSPDGRRIALTMPDAKKVEQIWIHDRSSGTTTQLTFDGENVRPTWSPDGSRVAFSTSRGGGKWYIWSAPADGSGKGERAGEGPEVTASPAVSWTRDGKWIVLDGRPDDGKGAGGDDVFAIPTSGPRTMRPAIATPAREQSGEVSPDGKWIAYGSDDTGRNQIYIQPFLTPGGRTLVSASHAAEHVWTSNNELMYVNDADSMTLAHLEFGPTIKVTRTALFDHRPFQSGNPSVRRFDVSRDGKSFVFVRPAAQRAVLEPIVVMNWVEEVRRLMAATGAR